MFKPWFIALSLVLANTVYAYDPDFLSENVHRQTLTDNVHEFNEVEVALPDVPNPNEGDWLDLYIEPMYNGQPRILMSSIQTAPDGSIHYLLNERSGAGYNNISAEAFLCPTGMKLLDSEGAKIKVFAYASYVDIANQRWLPVRNPNWIVMDGKRSTFDKIHRVLYDAFCMDGKAKNDHELRKRLIKQSSRKVNFEYGK